MFVDDPDGAVAAADRLVTEAMTRADTRSRTSRRAQPIFPCSIRARQNHRIARALSTRRERGEAATEELRQAVVNYRTLFDDLLATDNERTDSRCRAPRLVGNFARSGQARASTGSRRRATDRARPLVFRAPAVDLTPSGPRSPGRYPH